MRVLTIVLLTTFCGAPARAAEGHAPKPRATPIPRAVADEWAKKIYTKGTWYGFDAGGRWVPADEPERLTDPIPFFWFPAPQGKIEWDKLPDPKVPFGVELGRSPSTDATIEQLKGFKTLAAVYLGPEMGIESVKHLKQVTHLSFGGCFMTDAGLEHFKEMKNLKSLRTDTQFSDSAVKKLRDALSGCEFDR